MVIFCLFDLFWSDEDDGYPGEAHHQGSYQIGEDEGVVKEEDVIAVDEDISHVEQEGEVGGLLLELRGLLVA